MSYYQLLVVIDNGLGVIKVGLVGFWEFQFVYLNIIGCVKGYSGLVEGVLEVCVGDQVQDCRSLLFIRYCCVFVGRVGVQWKE